MKRAMLVCVGLAATGAVLGAGLPGSKLTIEEAVRGDAVFVAVWEARDKAASEQEEAGVREATQRFKVLDLLVGELRERGNIRATYVWLDVPDAREREIGKGERVIWIAGPPRKGLTAASGVVFSGIKAVADTAATRGAVTKAAEAAGVGVPWGEVSGDLQCRLLPEAQIVEVADGTKPWDVETPQGVRPKGSDLD